MKTTLKELSEYVGDDDERLADVLSNVFNGICERCIERIRSGQKHRLYSATNTWLNADGTVKDVCEDCLDDLFESLKD